MIVKKELFAVVKYLMSVIACRVNHTIILDDPFDDPPGLQFPDRSPEPTKEQLAVSMQHFIVFGYK